MLDEFKNAFQRHNNAHIQLIIINVVVFGVLAVLSVFSKLFELLLPFTKRFMSNWPFLPCLQHSLQGPGRLSPMPFVHDVSGIFHILFNMLAFYWFAKLIIEYLGNDKLIALYFLGALAGAFFI